MTKSIKHIFQVQVLFVCARCKSLYIYINTMCLNKNYRNWSPRLSFIIHKCGVSPFHGLIVASLRINQFYVKLDKVKTKSYLHQNHSICQIFLFVNCFHLQEQPNSSQCHILHFDLFCLSNNGIQNSVFQVFMKT